MQIVIDLRPKPTLIPSARPANPRALDAVEAEPVAIPHILLSSSDQHIAWSRIENEAQEPTPGQARVMLATERAMAAGLTYTKDVDAFVRHDLGEGFFTSEDLARGVGHVEGGYVGMEIYYALDAYEKRLAHARRCESATAIQVGQIHKDIEIFGGVGVHRYSKMVVESVDLESGMVKLLASKRGTKNKWNVTLPATHKMFRPMEAASEIE